MTIGKLCLVAFLGAMPALASAQPSVSVDVGVNVGLDAYDTVAPGDPVESVDVFYDQLSPYGEWVDEPDVGRVFVPDTAGFVPYTSGHWEYTNLGFVWISAEPYAWATSHYGRWAYSNNYQRWYWLPDTAWGPAWVEWRQTGSDFGWAPLAPDVVVRAGWQPPIESWHYCSAERVLDPNVTRYYEPRARVVEIHRGARPLEHYSTVSNVRVVVGPPPTVLREHHVAVRRVKVEPRAVGRWTPVEAHAQVERAQEHRAVFETQNQHRIEGNAQLHAAHVKVLETHPQIKAQVTARVQAGAAANGRVEPPRAAPGHRPATEPARVEPGRRAEPARPAPATQVEHAPAQHEPARVEPGRRVEPARPAPAPQAEHAPAQHEPRPTEHAPAPKAPEPHPAATHPAEPNPREHVAAPAGRPPAPPSPAAAPPRAPEPSHRSPEPRPPEHAQPQRAEPPRGTERKEPDHKEPDRKDDRKEPDRH